MVADDGIKVGSNMSKPRCPAHSSYDILAICNHINLGSRGIDIILSTSRTCHQIGEDLQSQSQSHPQHITLYSQSKYLQAIKHGNEQSTIYR